MKKLKIRLLSDFCAGNGESVGLGIDADICADKYGFPYIPGKRIMGCLRETAETLKEYGLKTATEENIEALFGNAYGKEGLLCIGNACLPGIGEMHRFVEDLHKDSSRVYLKEQCTEEKILSMYSSIRGQTEIQDGREAEGSLRMIRVLNRYNPLNGNNLELFAPMDYVGLTSSQEELLQILCQSLRHMGQKRNRGLGEVLITIESDEDALSGKINDNGNTEKSMVEIFYKVFFDHPITIQEYLEEGGEIKGRSVIGAFSRIYLDGHTADDTFTKLFLDGTVRWSALTPVINGVMSDPVPQMFMKLKNDKDRLINTFTEQGNAWKLKKPKSLDGSFASFSESEKIYYLAKPQSEEEYHNRIHVPGGADNKKKGLYTQESLQNGMVYGGKINLPSNMLEEVCNLFQKTDKIRLGRGKKTQYGLATLRLAKETFYDEDKKDKEYREYKEGDILYVLLKSDLVLQRGAWYSVEQNYVRECLAEALGIKDSEAPLDNRYHDICRYRVLSGYQAMWHMQKPKVLAVMGGSVYCFKVKADGHYKTSALLGEYLQEGLGVIECLSSEQLKVRSEMVKGRIDTLSQNAYSSNPDNTEVKELKNYLLRETVMEKLQNYAFYFEKFYFENKGNKIRRKDIPERRIRQLLNDSKTIRDLWDMVDKMKTSDVSSEAEGKKKTTNNLLKEFYGTDETRPEINAEEFLKLVLLRSEENKSELSEDEKCFIKEVLNNDYVKGKLEQKDWKVPLSTLLHNLHYRNEQKGGGRK